MPRIRFDFVTWPSRSLCAVPQDLERAVVAERRPDPAVQPAYGLEVVREHVGAGLDHRRDVAFAALEVGRQDLHSAPGHGLADRPDRGRPDPRAPVGEVVAGHPGHDDEAEPHLANRVGDLGRFVLVHRVGLPRPHVAEAATPRARVPEDQERRLPLLPALGDVRAHRFLAHGVERARAHDGFELSVVRPALQPNLEPRRLALGGGGRSVRRDDRQVEASLERVVFPNRHRSPV
jgi:hypothetical protein